MTGDLSTHRTRTRSERPLALSLAVLAGGTFVVNLDGFLLSGLLPAVAADLGVSVAEAGLLAAVFSATYAISAPVIAALSFGADRRRLLALAALTLAAGLVIQATAPSFAVAIVGRVLAGVGAAGYQSTASAAAGFLAEPERRGRALATVLLGGTAALVLGAPLGIIAGGLVGWRVTTAALAGLAIVVAAITGLIRRFNLPAVPLRDRAGVILDPKFAAVLVMTALVMVPGYLLLTYVAVILSSAPLLTAIAVLVFGVGQVAANRAVGPATDSRGPLPVLAIGITIGVLSLIALALSRPWPIATIAAYGVAGVALGLLITPQQIRLFAIDAPRATVALGLNGSAIHVAAMSAAAIGASVLATAGPAWLVPTALVIAALGAALLWPLAPERWARTQPGRPPRDAEPAQRASVTSDSAG